MDAAGIITGAIVAIVAGFVVPFITTQYALWSKQKRAMYRDRRAAVSTLIEAETEVHLNIARQVQAITASGKGGHAGPTDLDYATIRVARLRLLAMLTTSDSPIKQLLISEASPGDWSTATMTTPGSQTVLATWAAGRDARARRAARRLVKERAEQSERDPEHKQTHQSNSEPSEE